MEGKSLSHQLYTNPTCIHWEDICISTLPDSLRSLLFALFFFLQTKKGNWWHANFSRSYWHLIRDRDTCMYVCIHRCMYVCIHRCKHWQKGLLSYPDANVDKSLHIRKSSYYTILLPNNSWNTFSHFFHYIFHFIFYIL